MENPIHHFLSMGGFAFYVWTSYAVVFTVLLFNIVKPTLQRRRVLRKNVEKSNASLT